MTQFLYQVLVGEEVVASDMNLETALVLTKALFQTYYEEPELGVSIKVQ